MGFTTANFPPVDTETFKDKPLMERTRALSTHWVEYGFGSPKQIHVLYVVKVLTFIAVGITIATLTSEGTGPPWAIGTWWNEPIVYQKFVIWTMLCEAIGIGGSWGPLAAKFKPMTGGYQFFARIGTMRNAPWPDKVPGTAGHTRTVLDVGLYLTYLALLAVSLVLPGRFSQDLVSAGADTSHLAGGPVLLAAVAVLLVLGLRDKVSFLAARAEQYIPPAVFFSVFGLTNMIVALKLWIAIVWIGAGVSKIGSHFSNVVPPMLSNGPLVMSKAFKRSLYRSFPNDLRPSHVAHFMAHAMGTVVEIGLPLILLFVASPTVALLAAIGMIVFHFFIISAFPLAVPLEWNITFAYSTLLLFIGWSNYDGYGLSAFDPTWLLVLIAAFMLAFPIVGNLKPEWVSFLPSLRQYAGNWASATWAFKPGAEEKLNLVNRPCGNQVDQLIELGYEPEVAEITMQQPIGWRTMHSQGRGLFSILLSYLPDVDTRAVREAEFCFNSLAGFNFGDGHFHNAYFIEGLQEQCNFEPGELIVAWVEAQPIHKKTQEYQVIDAATGVIERGTWLVPDAVKEQPWLPNGPIPLTVTWRHPDFNSITGLDQDDTVTGEVVAEDTITANTVTEDTLTEDTVAASPDAGVASYPAGDTIDVTSSNEPVAAAASAAVSNGAASNGARVS